MKFPVVVTTMSIYHRYLCAVHKRMVAQLFSMQYIRGPWFVQYMGTCNTSTECGVNSHVTRPNLGLIVDDNFFLNHTIHDFWSEFHKMAILENVLGHNIFSHQNESHKNSFEYDTPVQSNSVYWKFFILTLTNNTNFT